MSEIDSKAASEPVQAPLSSSELSALDEYHGCVGPGCAACRLLAEVSRLRRELDRARDLKSWGGDVALGIAREVLAFDHGNRLPDTATVLARAVVRLATGKTWSQG